MEPMRTADEHKAAAQEARKRTASAAGNKNSQTPTEENLPEGFSPVDYLAQGLHPEDLLLGEGFLERRSTLLTIAQSGVGKSSAAMQSCCCWATGRTAFDLDPFNGKRLRIVMIQNEDSRNDLHRQSLIVEALNIDAKAKDLLHQNFRIFTVRGKIGIAAIGTIKAILDKQDGCDLLVLNPMSAYAAGDLAKTEDCVDFLYTLWSPLLDDYNCGGWLLHHTPKTIGARRQQQKDWTSFDYMYSGAGAATITNYARGVVTIDPVGNSTTFSWRVAKRLQESGWPLQIQYFKWQVLETGCKMWVPASSVESQEAERGSRKKLEDLYALVPASMEPIRKPVLMRYAMDNEGFTRREYDALLAETLQETTPDSSRLYEWRIYNPNGAAFAAICRREQPDDEKAEAVKARVQEQARKSKIVQMPTTIAP
jgi:hypothetical protein